MKPRRVIVTLELTTNLTMDTLRYAPTWASMLHEEFDYDAEVHQIQANVVKAEKGGKAK